MDDVLIDAPYMITKEMLTSMHVSVVLTRKPTDTAPTEVTNAHASNGSITIENVSSSSSGSNGKVSSGGSSSSGSGIGSLQHEYNPLLSIDPYTVPQAMGILHRLDRKHTMSVFDIIGKIEDQKESLTKKFDRKRAQEQEFYARKYGNII